MARASAIARTLRQHIKQEAVPDSFESLGGDRSKTESTPCEVESSRSQPDSGSQAKPLTPFDFIAMVFAP